MDTYTPHVLMYILPPKASTYSFPVDSSSRNRKAPPGSAIGKTEPGLGQELWLSLLYLDNDFMQNWHRSTFLNYIFFLTSDCKELIFLLFHATPSDGSYSKPELSLGFVLAGIMLFFLVV